MQSVYLIRHAKTRANKEGRLCGKTESELLENEYEIRKILMSKIIALTDPAVISSPRKRTYITAKSLGYEVLTEEGLSEFDFGNFEGMTHSEIMKEYPDLFSQMYADTENFRYPGGEDKKTFFSRVSETYEKIRERCRNNDEIVVVSHAGVIQALISYILTGADSLYWNFVINNCTVIKIYYCEGTPVIEYIK